MHAKESYMKQLTTSLHLSPASSKYCLANAAHFAASHHTTGTTLPRTKFGFHLQVPVPCAARRPRTPKMFLCNCRCGRNGRTFCSGCCCKELARTPCPEASGSDFSMRFPSLSADPRHHSTRALLHRPRWLLPPPEPPQIASAAAFVRCASSTTHEGSRCRGPRGSFPLASAAPRRLRVAAGAADRVDRVSWARIAAFKSAQCVL